MSDILRTGFFLFVTCLIAAVCLAVTESVTAPRIREQAAKALLEAKKAVLPEAAGFPASISAPLSGSAIGESRSIEIAVDAQGKMIGTVQQVAPKGYAGPINMVVGLKPDGTLSGVVIQSMIETPGLGTKLKDEFLTRFLGLMKEKGLQANVKVKQDNGDVDAITAATVSSRAFCKGVREAMELVQKNAEAIQAQAGKSRAPGSSVPETVSPVSHSGGVTPAPVQNGQSVVDPKSPVPVPAPTLVPPASVSTAPALPVPGLPNLQTPGVGSLTPTPVPALTPAPGGVTP